LGNVDMGGRRSTGRRRRGIVGARGSLAASFEGATRSRRSRSPSGRAACKRFRATGPAANAGQRPATRHTCFLLGLSEDPGVWRMQVTVVEHGRFDAPLAGTADTRHRHSLAARRSSRLANTLRWATGTERSSGRSASWHGRTGLLGPRCVRAPRTGDGIVRRAAVSRAAFARRLLVAAADGRRSRGLGDAGEDPDPRFPGLRGIVGTPV